MAGSSPPLACASSSMRSPSSSPPPLLQTTPPPSCICYPTRTRPPCVSPTASTRRLFSVKLRCSCEALFVRQESFAHKEAPSPERTIMTDLQYFTGFGNEFATEARPGALPVGQNAPQKAPLGLYTEQLSGSPCTAPRLLNRRTWTYRIRPSVMHKPYERIANGLVRSTPFNEVETTPSQLRWDPLPLPTKPRDFVDGLTTLAGSGDLSMHSGNAIHIYAATKSMTDRFFYSADGELLIVPQLGRLMLHTELGILDLSPGEIALVPRGIKFRVELLSS